MDLHKHYVRIKLDYQRKEGNAMKKLNLFSAHEVVGIMQWLNEQASFGWELKEWGSIFVKFQESDGPRCQYQLDLDNWEDGANEERRSELEALGWKYVDTIGGTKIHIYRSEDLSASIPPNEEFIAFHKKRLRITPIRGFISLLLAVSAIFPMFSSIPYKLLEVTMTNKYGPHLIAVLWLMIAYEYIKRVVYQQRLYRYLEDIREIPIKEILRRGDYHEKNIFPRVLYWGILIGGILFLWRLDNTQDERDLADADATTRYVDLAEFQDDDFKFAETTWSWSDYPDINRAKYISYKDGIFVEQYYEIRQYGYEIWDISEDLEGHYWIGVNENVQGKLFSQIVDRYTNYHYHYELFHRKEYNTSNNWIVAEQTDERFDRLVIADGILKFEGYQLIFAQMDEHIVYLKYLGEKDISTVVEELVKVF